MPKQKPALTLTPGKRTLDVDRLASAFKNLTGRTPTAAELERAKAKLKKGRAA